MESVEKRIMEEMRLAEGRAWGALSGYKFWMFGYWAAAWVKYNSLLPAESKQPNPFKRAVKLSRAIEKEKENGDHQPLSVP